MIKIFNCKEHSWCILYLSLQSIEYKNKLLCVSKFIAKFYILIESLHKSLNKLFCVQNVWPLYWFLFFFENYMIFIYISFTLEIMCHYISKNRNWIAKHKKMQVQLNWAFPSITNGPMQALKYITFTFS